MLQNFKIIVAQQKKLDKEILTKFNRNYENTLNERKLALLVELSELANEIRSFKYWSVKPRSEDERILDEYADVLHFISGFAVQYQVTPIFSSKKPTPTSDNSVITKKIFKLFKIAIKINGKKKVLKFLKKYIELGYLLGYDVEKIKASYDKKHAVNIERQKTNY